MPMDDDKEALEFFKHTNLIIMAKNNNEKSAAEYNLGMCYKNGKGIAPDSQKAYELFLSAASYGQIDSEYQLALCYENAYGTEQQNEQALKYYLRAAKKNHVTAQFNLALCYKNGKGINAPDYDKAFEWFKKAAGNGDVGAKRHLAECYENGHGVEKDLENAFHNYLDSAEKGNVIAQHKIAECYEKGELGKLIDIKEALFWYKKAGDNGYPDALMKSKELESALQKQNSEFEKKQTLESRQLVLNMMDVHCKLFETQGQQLQHLSQSSKVSEAEKERIEKELIIISTNPKLKSYYDTFLLQFTSFFNACNVIYSGMVSDNSPTKLSAATNVVGTISSYMPPIANIMTDMLSRGLQALDERLKRDISNRASVFFPKGTSEIADIIARTLTLNKQNEILKIEENLSPFEAKISKLSGDNINTRVKKLADEHFHIFIASVLDKEKLHGKENPRPQDIPALLKIIYGIGEISEKQSNNSQIFESQYTLKKPDPQFETHNNKTLPTTNTGKNGCCRCM